MCFILGSSGCVYAESEEDNVANHSEIQQEAISNSKDKKTETKQTDYPKNLEIKKTESTKENSSLKVENLQESKKDNFELVNKAEIVETTENETENVDEKQSSIDQANLDQELSKEDEDRSGIRKGLKDTIKEIDAQESDSKNEKQEATEDDKSNELNSEESLSTKLEENKVSKDVEILEKGSILDLQALKAGNPSGVEASERVEVKSFEELKDAINSAKDGVEKTIIITQSFEIKETLTIESGKIILLTSNNNKKMDDPWKPIEQPKDYKDEGENKQREIIKEARKRGEEAEEKAKININKTGISLYSKYDYIFEDKEIVLKRFNNFTGTMFKVLGKLTLGDNDSSINFDGNKKNVVSNDRGTFFYVSKGGELVLNNGVIASGKNGVGYNGSIYLQNGAKFTMNGGRISSNEVEWAPRNNTLNAGGVYAARGSKFIMNNGMIDHNIGTTGGLFIGDLYPEEEKDLFKYPNTAAIVKMNGGYIIGNQTNGTMQFSGAVTVFSGGTFTLKDGIIAGNSSYGNPNSGAGSGAVYISDGFIGEHSNTIGDEWANIASDYKKYVSKNKAEANFNGGLIYDNYASWSGGGLFIDSEYVGLNRIMILDNRATKWGGGIYYSFPPMVNKLEHMLVTENSANIGGVNLNDEYWGGPAAGGGLWNCPTGYVHLGDGHSLYIYNNEAEGKGTDISFAKKAHRFLLNGKDIHEQFYSHVSPITENGNIIKYLNDDRKSKEFIPDDMSYTSGTMYLRSVYSDKLIKEAWSNSNAFILGNSSSYGGGIGSNANLITVDKGNIDFTFKKNWHKDIDKKEYEHKKLHIDIFIVPENVDEVYVRSQYGYDDNLFKYGEVILSSYNNWQARFSEWNKNQNKNLPVTEDHGLPFTNEDLAKLGLKYLIIERETGYATNVVQKDKGSSVQYGKLTITKDQSKDWPAGDKRESGADFYFYELDKNGIATYLGKSKILGDDTSINSEFVHPILNNKFVNAFYYGVDEDNPRYVVEYDKGAIDHGYVGYLSTKSEYAIFIEKVNDGIIFHVPYLFIQSFDKGNNYSGLKLDHKQKGGPLVVEPYGYEFTINNSPFTEAKIKKIWKMLSEEEIKKALGEYGKDAEVKNREIPDQVTFYILKDGKRIAIDYKRDKDGKVYPIYKTVTLSKKDGWEGVITQLDPILLEKGSYGIEEEALEGFKSSYEFKKILKNSEEFKKKDEENLVSIKFVLKKFGGYRTQEGKHVGGDPFKEFLGDIKVNLFVDGLIKDSKTMKWKTQEDEFGKIIELKPDNMFFGYDQDKKIIVDGKNKPIKVEYYNYIKNDIGYRNLELNLYLKQDKDGIYSLYVPNVLVDGNFAQVFDIVDENGKDIDDFNPIKKVDPIYEYLFEVTNEEIPPKPPKPEEPPEEPPHNPPETPPEEPEEPPVIPPEVPEEVEEIPVISPKKPGGAPQTGVESVGSYVLIAISSSLGLGYIRRKKH